MTYDPICPKCKFQFPSNGKADPKFTVKRGDQRATFEFQFPSNGKADPKGKRTEYTTDDKGKFQFPSNGKADPKADYGQVVVKLNQFQFPSNGKADPKSTVNNIRKKLWNEFQFPSNGKADPKGSTRTHCHRRQSCFNSLQTGKQIQSRCLRILLSLSLSFCFNSLQTGKQIQSTVAMAYTLRVRVSIPFKRESRSKVESRLKHVIDI